MIRELGRVASCNGEFVVVEVDSGEHCAGCGMCAGGKAERKMTVFNSCGLQVGDRVRVSVDQSQITKISFLLYVLPIIDLMLGYYLGDYLDRMLGTEFLAAVLALLLMSGSYLALYYYDRSRQDQLRKMVTIEPYADDFVTIQHT